MNPDRQFLLSDVMEIIGIKKTSLENWLGFRYIVPSIQEATGTGSRNIFNLEDLCKIALFKRLIERGFSRKEASKFANASMAPDRPDLGSMFNLYLKMWEGSLLVDPAFIAYKREGEEIKMFPLGLEDMGRLKRILKNADECFILNINQMITEICTKVGISPEGIEGEGKTLLTKRSRKK